MNADSYKTWHRPSNNPNIKVKQGYYKLQHPEKYIGNPTLIIFRSSWEYSFCRWCDVSPSVIKWSSEPTSIPYADKVSKLSECKKYGLNPNDPRNWVMRNYHVDFWIMIQKGETQEKWFIEIKPSSKLKKPIPPSIDAPLKIQKRFVLESKEYLINESKWNVMSEYAQKNNVKFYIFTEQILEKMGIIGGKFDHPSLKNK